MKDIWKFSIQDEYSLKIKKSINRHILSFEEEIIKFKTKGFDIFFITKSNSGKNYTLRVAFDIKNKYNLKRLSQKHENKLYHWRQIGKYTIYESLDWVIDGESGEYICRLGDKLENAILKAQNLLKDNNIPPYLYVPEYYNEKYNTPEGKAFKSWFDNL